MNITVLQLKDLARRVLKQARPWWLIERTIWLDLIILVAFLIIAGWMFTGLLVRLPEVVTDAPTTTVSWDERELGDLHEWQVEKAERQKRTVDLVRGRYFIQLDKVE